MTAAPKPEPDIARTVAVLGGTKMLGSPIRSQMDAHDSIQNGLPAPALQHLVMDVKLLSDPKMLDNALGISLRTFQRYKTDLDPSQGENAFGLDEAPAVPARSMGRAGRRDIGPAVRPPTLSPEQSSRLWKFAEIFGRAAEILGSRAEAEAWLNRPAPGLDQRKPIDLLSTPVGTAAVDDLLTRMEFGVYT